MLHYLFFTDHPVQRQLHDSVRREIYWPHMAARQVQQETAVSEGQVKGLETFINRSFA